jgi:hypothetical protein|tara:strand:- start:333 stop:557 length:225 start_codon:yes stop_codon:yes gene_type:complete
MCPDQFFLFTSEKTIQLILALAAAKGLFAAQTPIVSRHTSQNLLLAVCLGITLKKLIDFNILGVLKINQKTSLN